MLIAPEALPLDIAIILSAAALIIVVLAALGKRYNTTTVVISVIGFVIAIALLVAEALGLFGAPQQPGSGSVIASDWISILFGVSILAVSTLVGLGAADYMKGTPNLPSFYALLVFTTIGSLMLAFSTDLLMIFVAWELMSIPSYVLTGFRKKDPDSNEAAVKYFLISAFASAVLLYGISLIYLLTGTTNIYTILQSASGYQPIAVLALTFVLAGFGIKLAAVPFHMWIPDAYQGAPTVVSALLSAGTKGATFAPAARIFFVVFAASAFQQDWRITFAVLAVLSMTLGNFAALTQKSVTRILAYSSIGQAGYILIGFAAGGTAGLTGSFFHILNYSIMQTGAFLAAALIIRQVGSDDLSSFDGVGRRLRVAPIALTLSLLALGGFPPLNGFWSKLVLFYSAIQANLGWLAIIAIINSFASIAFYLRIVKHMYVNDPPSFSRLFESNAFRAALIIASVVIVIFGIYPYPFLQFASATANSFLHG
ncbi:MAG TPA: NADH-quinone oxidoreductase subunit N [Nitrososphaerales archaeon]|nr:NADH-quinone oxidoreductase subunit N [Nitrososphaerales archaeon]